MDAAVPLLVLLIVAVVAWVVTAPLRGGRAAGEDAAEAAEVERLTAAKDAKLREIRETELDWRTGKLSDADHRAIDRQLRAEAAELLRRLDELGYPSQP